MHDDFDLLEQAVQTASPAELTLFLYDGAIRFINEAIAEMAAENYDAADAHITRVGNIILELQATLDRQYKIADAMHDLYQYMYRQLGTAMTNRMESRVILREMRELLRDFRDTWKRAMELAAA